MAKSEDNLENTLVRVLGLKNMSDVIDMDFKDSSIEDDNDRNAVSIYANRIRGSVRLNSEAFYTVKELDNIKHNIRSFTLP